MKMNKDIANAFRKTDADALAELIGDDWRDQRVRARDAAKIFSLNINSIYRFAIRGDGGLTAGMLYDYAVRRKNMPRPGDFDTISRWSHANRWPLEGKRGNALKFMRTAYAARIAEKDLSTATCTTSLLRKWGWDDSKIRRITVQIGPSLECGWATNRRTGGRFKVWLWPISRILDLFIAEAAVEITSRDPARDCFRGVATGVKTYLSDPTGWVGAVGLQRAWNYYWNLMSVPVGHLPRSPAVTSRRLNNYMAKATSLLAAADPDWSQQPIDPTRVNPAHTYVVWVPVIDPANVRQDVVHSPVTALALRVYLPGYAYPRETTRLSKAIPVDRGRITREKGEYILAAPHAYTF